MRLVETSGFTRLDSGYTAPMTHGGAETITIVHRDGREIGVEDYGQAAPEPFWLVSRAIAGAAFGATWKTTTRTKPVGH